MTSKWSPHPRYRLYTSPASYIPRLTAIEGTIQKLESEICRRFKVDAAVCVPMARTGIYLTLREVIHPGQTVIMSPLTIIDVVNAVLAAGGIPVFADICRKSCAIDPGRVESLLDKRTGAVLVTHLHGRSAGAHAFRDVCIRRGVPLIEDAAQAFGAIESGRHLGTIGDAGIYSFGFFKNLPTWRGGMVVSNDRGLIASIRSHVRKLARLSMPPCSSAVGWGRRPIPTKRTRSGAMNRFWPSSTAPRSTAASPRARVPAVVSRPSEMESTSRTLPSRPAPGVPERQASASTPTSACPRAIASAWKTSSQTATTWGRTGWRTATITLAVHAWHGETVAVLHGYGDRAVWVERDGGDRRIIPVSWTSLIPRASHRLADGGTIRICPQAALELSRWVSARLNAVRGAEAC